MADCPGVLHLAEMADGGLARLRLPGGRLTSVQARAVAELAEKLGSGVIDLTNRANLQIRGLSLDSGATLADALSAVGLFVDGPADRRRNVLLDPLAGLDPTERLDLRPMGDALVAALVAAPWIETLSPKFAFVLDGGGRTGVAAIASDVAIVAARPPSGAAPDRAGPDHDVTISLAGRPLGLAVSLGDAVAAALAIARMAADAGPDARGRDLSPESVAAALVAAGLARPGEEGAAAAAVTPTYGVLASADPGRVAVILPVAVGRLDARTLRWLADSAERWGEGVVVLAPWSAAVIPGLAPHEAEELLASSERAGFPTVAVADRLTVIACAGAGACVRAREPAKTIGLALLRTAADRLDLLPAGRSSVHVSACAKGCAGSAPADLLLLGSSETDGLALHPGGAPREPGPAVGRVEPFDPAMLLARLGALRR